jgi:hypothetical protein
MTKHTPKRVHLLPLAGRVRIGDWTIKMTHCKKIPKKTTWEAARLMNRKGKSFPTTRPICYGAGYTKLEKT